MHRLAGWFGHGTGDVVEILEGMLSHCSVARPAHSHADPDWGMAADQALAIEGDLAALITGRPRIDAPECAGLPAAAAILELCDGQNNLTSIVEKLEQKYEATGIEADVREMLESALNNGWIREFVPQ